MFPENNSEQCRHCRGTVCPCLVCLASRPSLEKAFGGSISPRGSGGIPPRTHGQGLRVWAGPFNSYQPRPTSVIGQGWTNENRPGTWADQWGNQRGKDLDCWGHPSAGGGKLPKNKVTGRRAELRDGEKPNSDDRVPRTTQA